MKKAGCFFVVVLCAILVVVAVVISRNQPAPSCEFNYSIYNQVYVGGSEGYGFLVEGDLTLTNYDKKFDVGDRVVIRANAVDVNGLKTNISTYIVYGGDGVYHIKMDSFYRYNAEIVSVEITSIKRFP